MKTRFIFPGAVFHIMQRGVGSEHIFIEDSDRTYFLYLLKDTYKDFGIVCYAYCLMDTHVHLLIKDTLAQLPKFMKMLFQRYAQFFNLKYKRKGHLFARRYEAKLCLEDSYLLTLSRYIHLNPLKAKIVNSPIEYRWSSYQYYIGRKNTLPEFLDLDFILKMTSLNENTRMDDYRKFVEGFNRKDALGYPENFYDIIGNLKALSKLNLKVPLWLTKIIEACDIPTPERIKGCRDVKNKEARRYLITQLQMKNFPLTRISELLDCHYTTVYRITKKEKTCI